MNIPRLRNWRVCAFPDGNDCSLQPVKPEQCEGFPNRWVFPGWRDVCEAVEGDGAVVGGRVG